MEANKFGKWYVRDRFLIRNLQTQKLLSHVKNTYRFLISQAYSLTTTCINKGIHSFPQPSHMQFCLSSLVTMKRNQIYYELMKNQQN